MFPIPRKLTAGMTASVNTASAKSASVRSPSDDTAPARTPVASSTSRQSALTLSVLAVATVAAATAAIGLGAPTPAHATGQGARPAPVIKNVIFFLGDGMGPVTRTAARVKYYGEDGTLQMDRLPYSARIKTWALDAQTTDSAPSMATYMTGVKTRNDVVGMDQNTVSLPFKPAADPTTKVANAINRCPTENNGLPSRTLLELAIAAGKATGAVTTARLTHATPAATYAHVCHRDAEYDIARQAVPGGEGANPAIGLGVDVLMGGVSYYWTPHNPQWNPRGRPDGRNLVAELQDQGYWYATDTVSLGAVPTAPGTRILALFDFAQSQGHMSYELDRDPRVEPSLSEMATKAIEILSKKPEGFFLMVEGGRIDHALHGTNAARALADTKSFDDAVTAAIEAVKVFDPELKESLFVVTADHDHTIAFNGYGKRGTDVLGLNHSYVDGKPSKDVNGVNYTTIVFGNGSNRPDVRVNLDQAAVTDKDYLQEVAIRRGSPGSETHGGGDVTLHAGGNPDAARLFRGTMENTKVFHLIKAAAGL